MPGARSLAASWEDKSGNLWLLGGFDYTPTGGTTRGDLNDLWKFNPATKTWSWVAGSQTLNAKGVYGTLGQTTSSNMPGGREGATSWVDSSGNFWLFGSGDGYDSNGNLNYLNDLWTYQP